jgi:hypothetical protein
MNFSKPFGPAVSETSEIEVEGDIGTLSRGDAVIRPRENADGEMGVTEFSRLLHRVSGHSKREIDMLIGELQALRDKLETDGQRLQNDVSEYTSLSQEVMQLTKIISESVRKLPDVQ